MTVTYHDACTVRYDERYPRVIYACGAFTVARMQAVESMASKLPASVFSEMLAENVPPTAFVEVAFDVTWEGDTPRLTVVNWEVVK